MAKTAKKAAPPATKKASPAKAGTAAKDKEVPTSLSKSLIASLPVSAEIMKHALAIEALLPQLDKELERSRKAGALSLARSFVVLHRMNARFDEMFKPFTATFTYYKTKVVPETFEIEGVPNVPLAEGFRVGVSSAFYASIKKDMKTAAYAWLQQNKLADIIQNTVNASSLAAALKSKLEDENIEAPAEIFTAAYVPNTSVTKI